MTDRRIVLLLGLCLVTLTAPLVGVTTGTTTTNTSSQGHHPQATSIVSMNEAGIHGNTSTESGTSVRARTNRTLDATRALATSTTLQLEEAKSGDSDQATLTYTFQVAGNASQQTSVSVSPSSDFQSGSDVSFEFVGWTDLDGSGSGSSTSWTATGGHRYQVEYRVEAQSGANAGDYSITSTASTGNGNSYSQQLSATVEILSPSFGTIGDQSTAVIFDETTDSSETRRLSVDIPNTGDGVLVTDSVSISSVPAGVSVSQDAIDDEISAGGSGELDMSVTVQDTVNEGTVQFSVTVSDNLDNTRQFDVAVEVSKPPVVAVQPEQAGVGDVLVGQSASRTISVSEIAGYSDINGLNVDITQSEDEATLDLNGLSNINVGAGGRTDNDVIVSTTNTAPQGEDLNWQVTIQGQDNDAPSTTFEVLGQVIYPPYYDGVTVPDTTLVYDRPRASTDAFTRTLDVRVTNGGDLPMEVESVTASGGTGIEAEVVDSPATIEARTIGVVTIRVSGDPDAAEQTVTYDVTLDANEPATVPGLTTGEQTVSGEVTIEHRAEITTQDQSLRFGEISISEERTRSTTISERLGYEDVQNFELQQVSGPDRWLEVVQAPSSLSAGEGEPFLVRVAFDANATLYQTYEWQFRANGDNVAAKNITVRAVPRPVQCTATKEELDTFDGSDQITRVANGMVTTIETLESRLRENPESGPIEDLTRACTAGRGTLVFLTAGQQAGSLIEAGNRSGAQQSVVRMAAGYNIMRDSLSQLETPAAREQGQRTVEGADTVLDNRLQSQFDHYTQQAESQDTPVLRKASVYRELATLAALEGDTDQARQYERQANESFTRYASLISSGNEHLQTARQMQTRMDRTLFVSVGGVRLFWIGALDTFESRREAVLSAYQRSADSFASAGASDRAETARRERRITASQFQRTYYVSVGLGIGFGVILLIVILYEALGLYRYIQDSRAVVSGDFLL